MVQCRSEAAWRASRDTGLMAKCWVTVADAEGKPWTMEVEAKSLYGAITNYNTEQVCGFHRNYPKLEGDSIVHVRLADGREFTRPFAQYRKWANAKAEMRNRRAI